MVFGTRLEGILTVIDCLSLSLCFEWFWQCAYPCLRMLKPASRARDKQSDKSNRSCHKIQFQNHDQPTLGYEIDTRYINSSMEMYDTTHPATLAQPLRWRTIEPSAVQVADPSVAPETMVDVQGRNPHMTGLFIYKQLGIDVFEQMLVVVNK